MTGEFKIGLAVSLGLHAAAAIGFPVTQPVAFDVKRAPSSMELYLVSPPTVEVASEAERDHEPPELGAIEPVPSAPEDPSPPTIVTSEHRGVVMEHLTEYLKNPPPVYPRLARLRGQEGTVMLEMDVLPSGTSGEVRVARSSGYPLLDQAAVEAVRQWVFRPAHRFRTPVTIGVEIPITFRLIDSSQAPSLR